jgi:uncharacterized protein
MMRKLVILSSVVILLVSMGSLSFAQEKAVDNARIEAAKKLMAISGATNTLETGLKIMGKQVLEMMVLRKPAKEVQIRKIMGDILGELSLGTYGVADQVAVIYAKEFTVEEMNEISAFYRTTVGKKMVTKLPLILQKSITIGQSWGRKVAGDIVRRFNEEAKKQGLKL